MKTFIKTISAAALGLSLSMGAVQADESAAAVANPFDMANPMNWFNMAGTAPQAAGGAVFHPLKPQSWAAMVSPEEHMQFHKTMTNPAAYAQYMQPAFYMEFMNPANYMAWMNPASYQVFMDPATYAYWMTPDAYMHTVNPAMYSGMFDMNNYMALMNPATYMAWMNPASYMAAVTPVEAPAIDSEQPEATQ